MPRIHCFVKLFLTINQFLATFLTSLCKGHFEYLKMWLHYCNSFFLSFLYNVRSIPNKFKIYQLSLQVKARLQTIAVKSTGLESILTFPKVFLRSKRALRQKGKICLTSFLSGSL